LSVLLLALIGEESLASLSISLQQRLLLLKLTLALTGPDAPSIINDLLGLLAVLPFLSNLLLEHRPIPGIPRL
jgi:hypothetical protein